jgi:FkbM family methyltransferase
LKHPECVAGCEDPRPFEHAGRLYVAFVGVWRRGGAIATSQLYALLRDDLTVETVFRPDLPGRQWPKEKNWGFFSRGGELYAVYSVHPRHVVLRLDGDRAEKVADEPYPWGWSGGFLRGGAPPVLVGDRFYNWTHGRLHHDGTSTYSVGLYTFAADPPFRPLAAVERPLLWANAAEAATTDRGNLAVVFPCGASLEDGRWTVTAGWNDNRLKRLVWDAAEVQLLLGALQTPPPWFRLRPDTSDRWVYDEVVGGNGYGLTTPAVKGRAVLDVGGHVGTFAFAVLARGAVAVHCYEADPGNAAVLQENAGHMPGVEVFPVPVRGACGELLRLKPLYDEWNRGGREVVPGQGLPQAVGIAEAVRRCAAADPAGRVGLLKLDCEGSEWGIFAGLVSDPAAAALIDRVVGEWHPPGWLAEVHAVLELLGFAVTGRPEADGRGVFTATRITTGALEAA